MNCAERLCRETSAIVFAILGYKVDRSEILNFALWLEVEYAQDIMLMMVCNNMVTGHKFALRSVHIWIGHK